MSDCEHKSIATYTIEDTGESAGIWACRDCKHKFYPWEEVEAMLKRASEDNEEWPSNDTQQEDG